jgi:hypothetical protein
MKKILLAMLCSIAILACVTTVVQAAPDLTNPGYFKSLIIGGGVDDADGGAEIGANGDASFSGDVTVTGDITGTLSGGFHIPDDEYGLFGTSSDFAYRFNSSSVLLEMLDTAGNTMMSMKDGGNKGYQRITGNLSVGANTYIDSFYAATTGILSVGGANGAISILVDSGQADPDLAWASIYTGGVLQIVPMDETMSPTGSVLLQATRTGASTDTVTMAADTSITLSAPSVGLGADDAYAAGWDGSLDLPTKNALYDKIETLVGGGGGNPLTVGSDDATSGQVRAYGDNTATGGSYRAYNAGGTDVNTDYFEFSTNLGGMIYRASGGALGSFNIMSVGSYLVSDKDFSFSNDLDNVQLGTDNSGDEVPLILFGGNASTEASDFIMYNGGGTADDDVDYWRFKPNSSGQFVLEDDLGADVFYIEDDTLNVTFLQKVTAQGSIESGINDNTQGYVTIWGDVDVTGAQLILNNAANEDTSTGNWVFEADGDLILYNTSGIQLRFKADGSGTELGGTYVQLPVKGTTGDPSSPSDGWMYVNTTDNKVRVYADGSWRDLATW